MVRYSQIKTLNKWYLALLVAAIVIHVMYIVALPTGIFTKMSHDTNLFWKVGVDFFATYEAGWDFLHCRNIYHHEEKAEDLFTSLSTGEQRAPYYTPYRYLPHYAATVGVVLNLFPPAAAYIIWIFFNELLLLINIEITRRLTDKARRFCWSIALWLAPFTLYVEYWMGQFSFFMASLLFWTIIAFMKKQRAFATAFWTASTVLKLFTLDYVVLFFRKRWIRDIFICLGILLIPSIIYFVAFPTGYQIFITSIKTGMESSGEGFYIGNFSVQTSLRVLLHILGISGIEISFGESSLQIQGVVIVVFSLLLGIYTLIKTLSHKADSLGSFVLLSLLLFFVVRDIWEHHYVMLIPLLPLMYTTGRISLKWTLIIFFLVASPTLFPLIHFERGKQFLQSLGIYQSVFYMYFFIKQAGVIIFFWQTAKSLFRISFTTSVTPEEKGN